MKVNDIGSQHADYGEYVIDVDNERGLKLVFSINTSLFGATFLKHGEGV